MKTDPHAEERASLRLEKEWGLKMLAATAVMAREHGRLDHANFCEELAHQARSNNFIVTGEYRGLRGMPSEWTAVSSSQK